MPGINYGYSSPKKPVFGNLDKDIRVGPGSYNIISEIGVSDPKIFNN
jgi:hypothetical protein